MSIESVLEKMAKEPSIVLNIPIFDTSGVVESFYPLPIIVSKESYRYRTIMGEHTLTLKFELPDYYEIPIGTYCEFQGQKYTLEKDPNIKKNATDKFEYDLVLQSAQYQLSKFILRNTVPGDSRLKFSYTARPGQFLQLLVDNMNARDEEQGWSFDENHIDAYEKVVSFNHNTCADALQMIAEVFETEWEIKGKTIFLRKVEYNKDNPLPLSYGKGNGFLPGLGRSEYSDVKPVERLFVQGGEDNIDASSYRRNAATGQEGSRELLMPANTRIKFDGVYFEDETGFVPDSPNVREYITDSDGASVVRYENRNRKGLLEGSLDCGEIYPMREGIVTKVRWIYKGKEYTNYNSAISAGAKQGEIFCDFFDTTLPANLDYSGPDLRIDGEKATVIFQSGMLTGKEFDIMQTDTKLSGYIHSERRFKLVSQEIDGMTMPNDPFCPKPKSADYDGDRYAVFHIGMPQSYIEDAEIRMMKQAVKYLYENEQPRFTFDGTLDAIWAKRNWPNIGGRIMLGSYIRFSDTQFLPDGMDIRITGIKDYINNPYKPQIELSNNSQSGSWLHNMQRQIESDEVLTESKDKQVVQYTKRRFRDVKETTDLLQHSLLNFSEGINPITVQTMQAVVGDESLQFRFVNSKTNPQPVAFGISFDPGTKYLKVPSGIIQHMTLGITSIKKEHTVSEYRFLDVSGLDFDMTATPDTAYYLYAVIPKNATAGTFEVSPYDPETGTGARKFDDGTNYNLLTAIINSESGGSRSIAPTYGYTEILPGRITTDRIVSTDGNSYMDLANSTMRLADEGYTKGMDWNETEPGQLTIKGTVNALSAVLGGFRIDNDKLQSLKQTNGQPHILLNGSDGVASITGSFESNADGNRVVIDPFSRTVRLISSSGTLTGEWSFSGEGGHGIYIFGNDGKYMLLGAEGLTSYEGRPGETLYGCNKFRIPGFSAEYDIYNMVLSLVISGLPTSAQGLSSGRIWRDGTTLRIVP